MTKKVEPKNQEDLKLSRELTLRLVRTLVHEMHGRGLDRDLKLGFEFTEELVIEMLTKGDIRLSFSKIINGFYFSIHFKNAWHKLPVEIVIGEVPKPKKKKK